MFKFVEVVGSTIRSHLETMPALVPAHLALVWMTIPLKQVCRPIF
jgi:hypothetical protein